MIKQTFLILAIFKNIIETDININSVITSETVIEKSWTYLSNGRVSSGWPGRLTWAHLWLTIIDHIDTATLAAVCNGGRRGKRDDLGIEKSSMLEQNQSLEQKEAAAEGKDFGGDLRHCTLVTSANWLKTSQVYD